MVEGQIQKDFSTSGEESINLSFSKIKRKMSVNENID
jgi:hypothetical protein